jgi:hypothetical protein
MKEKKKSSWVYQNPPGSVRLSKGVEAASSASVEEK